MSDKDLVEVVVVADRSGSMAEKRSDVIGGFNTFLLEQKKVPGRCLLTYVQFNNDREVVHEGKPIEDVPELTPATYVPNGGTALLDALGWAIENTDARLARLPAEKCPSQIIVVIITDGEENASRKFSLDKIREMIQARSASEWRFIYLGQGLDAFAEAGGLGIDLNSHLNYVNNMKGGGGGVSRAYHAMSYAVGTSRLLGEIDHEGTTSALCDDSLLTGDESPDVAAGDSTAAKELAKRVLDLCTNLKKT
jgi:hypothetical protein